MFQPRRTTPYATPALVDPRCYCIRDHNLAIFTPRAPPIIPDNFTIIADPEQQGNQVSRSRVTIGGNLTPAFKYATRIENVIIIKDILLASSWPGNIERSILGFTNLVLPAGWTVTQIRKGNDFITTFTEKVILPPPRFRDVISNLVVLPGAFKEIRSTKFTHITPRRIG